MSKKFTVLVGLLMAVAVTGYSVSGTYAKYTEDFTGTAKADIAKWAFEVGDSKTKADGTFTFDLFGTPTGEGESTVNPVIAPGDSGSFDIALLNNSNVDADVTIKLTQTGSTLPIVYKVDGVTVAADGTVTTIGKLNKNGATQTVTVEYEWVDDDTNDKDYASTEDTTNTITVTAVVTATQATA